MSRTEHLTLAYENPKPAARPKRIAGLRQKVERAKRSGNTISLTDAKIAEWVASAKDGADRIEVFDSKVKGLVCRVGKRGPSFSVVFRFDGEKRRQGIDEVRVDKARTAAGVILGNVRDGIDPRPALLVAADPGEPGEAAPLHTLRAVAERYIADLEHPHKKAHAKSYVDGARQYFEKYICKLGDARLISTITDQEIRAMVRRVFDTHPVTSNRLLSTTKRLFTYAVGEGIIAENPAMKVKREADEKARERTLDGDEVVNIWRACERLAADGEDWARAVQLLGLTGCRREEICALSWSEIDLEGTKSQASAGPQDGRKRLAWGRGRGMQAAGSDGGPTITIPGSRMKNGRVHVVPLSLMAVQVLKACPTKVGYVFPSIRDAKKPITNYSQMKRELDAKIAEVREEYGFPPMAGWHFHDLRRTLATQLGELGISNAIIGRVLSHTEVGVTAKVYNRWSYLPEKRAALKLFAEAFEEILTEDTFGDDTPPAEA
ncbi:integrase or site-specific recombinase [Aliidongia dinghuensis]|uniref:Integrase or site-specific recombinase n=1 Tax=Aliidongia dinghuensis TaxID=1867774 RepID=A0A8J3E3H7_9PROT|nr:tyrosine-type recombinase/integrase [Aliidongia dinghuensis]GGF19131.1 integrase or site-specific recombinase [Aliidongia dinghuensis]